ncbi:hypothetical protein GQ54DRAFT_306665 [Martensiomyces pterosporus]|nr:hypothetical protein GQ54DRAFT_306665 [Martensiomyces pterosporus]
MRVSNTIFALAYASAVSASVSYASSAPAVPAPTVTPVPQVPPAAALVPAVPIAPIPIIIADFIYSPVAPAIPTPMLATAPALPPAPVPAPTPAPTPAPVYIGAPPPNASASTSAQPVIPTSDWSTPSPSPAPTPSYRMNYKRDTVQSALDDLVSGSGAMVFNANGKSYMLLRLPVSLAEQALQSKPVLRKRENERDLIRDATTQDLGSDGLLYGLLGEVYARITLPVNANIGLSNPTDGSGGLLRRDNLLENLVGEVVVSAVAPLKAVVNINPDEDGNGLVPNLLGRVSVTVEASPTVTVHIFDSDKDDSGDLLRRDHLLENLIGEVVVSAVAPLKAVVNINPDEDGNAIMTDPRLLVQGHRKFHNGQLREAAAAYFEFIGNTAFTMRDSVLRQYTIDSDNARQTFNDLELAISRLESIYETLGRTATALPPTGSLHTASVSRMASSSTASNGPKVASPPTGRLPHVPLSELTRLLVLRTRTAAIASSKLRAQSSRVDTAQARRLMEQEQVEREKLSRLSAHMQAIEVLPATMWDICAVAREVARIDTRLFGSIKVPDDIVVRKRPLDASVGFETDVAKSVRNCAGFSVFLGHAVAGLLLDEYASMVSQPAQPDTGSTAPNPALQSGAGDGHSRDRRNMQSLSGARIQPHIVAYMVALASILIRVYGDFNGGVAILWALTLPEIRRLEELWQCAGRKATSLLEQLCDWVGMQIPPLNDVASGSGAQMRDEATAAHQMLDEGRYHEAIRAAAAGSKKRYVDSPLPLASLRTKDLIAAIPYMPRSIGNLRRLYSMYTMSSEGTQVLLSAPGAQMLDCEKRVLGWCRIHGSSKPPAAPSSDLKARSKQYTYEPDIYTIEAGDCAFQTHVPVTLSELVDAECADELQPHRLSTAAAQATSLAVSDASLQHWILTRPFFATSLIRSVSGSFKPPLPTETCLLALGAADSPEADVLRSAAEHASSPSLQQTLADSSRSLSNGAPDATQNGTLHLDATPESHRLERMESIYSQLSQADEAYAESVDAEQIPSVDEFLGQFLANEHMEVDESGIPDYLKPAAASDVGITAGTVSAPSTSGASDAGSVFGNGIDSDAASDTSGSGDDLELPSAPTSVRPPGDACCGPPTSTDPGRGNTSSESSGGASSSGGVPSLHPDVENEAAQSAGSVAHESDPEQASPKPDPSSSDSAGTSAGADTGTEDIKPHESDEE